MIPVKVALTFDRVSYVASLRKVVRKEDLDDDERVVYDYLDAAVESGVYASFDGGVFDMKVPERFANERIVSALSYEWELGGWLVGVFAVSDDGGERKALQVVFAPSGVERQPTRVEPAGKTELATEPAVDKPRVRVPGVKPCVLLISDVPGWAFDQNMRDLERYLSDEFDFEHFYTENWFRGERPDWSKYDAFYEAYHRNPPMGMPMDRALGALRSQWFKPERPLPPDVQDVAHVNKYRGFQVASKRNYDELAAKCPRVVYLTNPVDTRRFRQTEVRDRIVASWNGNARHKAPDGRYIKGYYDIAVPAAVRARVPLVAAEYNTTEGPARRRGPDEMPAFYQQANVSLCTSEYESASNSVMESMSSGLALLATDVGNHRELRDSQLDAYGDSGILLIERNVDAFAEALRQLTPERAREMGEINRREIETRWSWEKWAPDYAKFLRMALS